MVKSFDGKRDTLTAIGRNIQKRRKEIKMGSAEFAEKTGFANINSISRLETGATDISVTMLFRIAEVLDCNISYLVGDDLPPVAGNDVRMFVGNRDRKGLIKVHNQMVAGIRQLRLVIDELPPS